MINRKTINISYYLQKITEKAENFVIPILAFFAPIIGILITVGAFIFFDTATGIWKSRKNKVPITSKGLSAIISKMFLYQGSLLLAYLLDVFIIGDILEMWFSVDGLVVKVMALILVYIEMKSINENYKAVRGVDIYKELKNLISRTKEISSDIKDLKGDE